MGVCVLPFNMWTRTEAGFAFDGEHVYMPESLWIAFWTNKRLVVKRPFSVTNEMPPRGESKFITCNNRKQKSNWFYKNIYMKCFLYHVKIADYCYYFCCPHANCHFHTLYKSFIWTKWLFHLIKYIAFFFTLILKFIETFYAICRMCRPASAE